MGQARDGGGHHGDQYRDRRGWAAPARRAQRRGLDTLNSAVRIVPVPAGKELTTHQGRAETEAAVARYAAAMSGFRWTSPITAVVPAAAVLSGAALTGRQNNRLD